MLENILNVFKLGGPMMVPLVFLALAGIVIFLERFLYLHKGQIRAKEFVSGIKSILKKKRLLEALTLCDESYGPVPRVVKAALLSSDETPDAMAQAVNAAAINEFSLIERRVASVALIAKIAPLLGLMGTVIALLEIFYKMGNAGAYIEASKFSGQVYAALFSTATGLLICIAGWLGYSFLNGRVRALAHDIEWAANETMLFIMRGMPENEGLHLSGKKEYEKE